MSEPETVEFADDGKPHPGGCAENLWAMVAIDKDGNESVCGHCHNGTMTAAVTFTWKVVEGWRPIARAMVRQRPHIRIVIRQYSTATDIEEFTP